MPDMPDTTGEQLIPLSAIADACTHCGGTHGRMVAGEPAAAPPGAIRLTRFCAVCRYEVAKRDPDGAGRVMWGVRDRARGGGWVQTPDENGVPVDEIFSIRQSAEQWVRAKRYVSEGALGGW
jgi:hypothetical protein